jgi:hypothetical protein
MMCRACRTNREKRNAYRIFLGKPEGKRPPSRPRHRWKHIKMELTDIKMGDVD